MKINLLMLGLIMLISVVSGALVSEYFSHQRDLEMVPWITVGVNLGGTYAYGMDEIVDYYNITNVGRPQLKAEIDSDLWFDNSPIQDAEGIAYHYWVSDHLGNLQVCEDTNRNGLPDFIIWGTGTNDGITVVKRKILTDDSLIPGIYSLNVRFVPRENFEQ